MNLSGSTALPISEQDLPGGRSPVLRSGRDRRLDVNERRTVYVDRQALPLNVGSLRRLVGHGLMVRQRHLTTAPPPRNKAASDRSITATPGTGHEPDQNGSSPEQGTPR